MQELHPAIQAQTVVVSTPRPWRASWRLCLFMAVYRSLWCILLPAALLYLFKKGRKEPLYRQHIAERFGTGSSRLASGNEPTRRRIWLHAASLGELRGIAPLVNALLAQGDAVLISTLTPAGRLGAQSLFKEALQAQRLQVVYTPLEIASAVSRFIAFHRPDCALMSEIDTWPVLVTVIKRCGLPLAFINAQYPKKSFDRDERWWGIRSELFTAYDKVLCKSETHAQRFIAVSCPQVHVVGETRFDLPIAPHLLSQADAFLTHTGLAQSQRPIICIASAVEAEEALFTLAIQRVNARRAALGLPLPFWVIVPRSPQRFNDFFQQLNLTSSTLGGAATSTAPRLQFVRRSQSLDSQLNYADNHTEWASTDGMVGDSLGEMYFYLQLSQLAVVGASFVPLGSHNVIEPLALKKPVLVGPSIWGIEYPGVEALALGVLTQCNGIGADVGEGESIGAEINTEIATASSSTGLTDSDDAKRTDQAKGLIETLLQFTEQSAVYSAAMQGCEAFYLAHCGATQRHLAVLNAWFKP